MLSFRRRSRVAVIPLAMLMLTSCGRNRPSDSGAEEIIHDFWQGNYEYTQTMYGMTGEGTKKTYGESRGKLITDPYQQYEQETDASERQGIVEQYWYMQDGHVVYNVKISMADTPDQWMTMELGAKGSDAYINEGLSFAFDREETISGRKVCVYRAQSEEELVADYSQLPEEDRTGAAKFTVPYTMDVEYFIDFSEKEVVRIRLDGTGSAKAGKAANLMFSGMTREEAEQEILENGVEENWEVIYDIKNFNGPVEIEIPGDLKEL